MNGKFIGRNLNFLAEYLKKIKKINTKSTDIHIIEYIIEYGTVFIGRKPSEDFLKLSFEPLKNGCHCNAQKLILKNRLRYFEGYIIPSETDIITPVKHAWNVTPCGNVIDISLEALEHLFEANRRYCPIYHGIEIPTDFVLIEMLKKDEHSFVIGDYIKSLGINIREGHDYMREPLQIYLGNILNISE